MELSVFNTSMYDSVYRIQAVTSEHVQITPIPELYVPAAQSKNVEIFMTAITQGTHDITLYLESGGQVLDMIDLSFTTEGKRSPLGAILYGSVITICAGVVLYFIFRHRPSAT